ncbi:alpha-E domain-containing protein [Streptomyces sp. DSM 44917]|uniref:Alpha-E domain-containing protein n=1 Tax=Streptomyces boetiae TaxID=3075541 RepID=A0ABU2L3C0_9ACTN|nr:alpha-E domain-containing protein [Streptomyces sp. DSM 44917]MDT0306012.1 alpha-E domain-containing protein [Streptomyces sp. DSM 44917]
MLSRIAESLFWTGRYVERADDTARILDAYLHRLLEDPWSDEDAACRSLHAILGVAADPVRPCDIDQVLERLAFDRAGGGAIEGALGAARENARRAREVVSTEMWECLNSTWHGLTELRAAARRTGPHAYLGLVRSRAALFFGLADSTMNRDDGWRFVVLGRSLERVDMTARLLAVRVLAAVHAPDWPTLLNASGADESFLRAHGGRAGDSASVAGFLLLSRDFPRSVLHALSTAEACLAALGDQRRGGDAYGRRDPALLPVGRMRTRLEYLDPEVLRNGLPGLLRDLQEACTESARAVAERYFPFDGPVTWSQEGV